jgi:RNA polymerase sigma-54 factor
MVMELGHHTRPLLELQASPLQVMFAELLELPAVDLEQRIGYELERNPALERIEGTGCNSCGGRARTCPECGDSRWRTAGSVGSADDAVATAVDPSSLYRTVLDDARLELSPCQQRIAEYLSGSLDDRGFLTSTPDEVAGALGVSTAAVADVLAVLRGLGSPGLGARDVRECLLLQLTELERDEDTQPLVRALITEHLDALACGATQSLAPVLGVTAEQIQSAREFIRTHLKPSAGGPELEPWARPTCTPGLFADVAISVQNVDCPIIEVEVLTPVTLRVAPIYREVAEAISDRHVIDCVRRAESFLVLLNRRAETLRRVVHTAASAQLAMLLHGQPAPRPLTRVEVAAELGLHASTVSRAVANKSGVLPGNRLIPLSRLFEARQAVEDALRELIAGEERPLSDAQLAARLEKLGYRVARRTVAKYRTGLYMPAARARS